MREEDLVTSTQVEMTNKQLSQMYGALGILGNRQMNSRAADLKVARLIRAMAPDAESIIPLRVKIAGDALANIEDPEGISPLVSQQIAAKTAALQSEFDLLEVTVDLPSLRINEGDLPTTKKGDDGWQNGSQMGAIVADLGELFAFDDDDPPPAPDPNDEPEK